MFTSFLHVLNSLCWHGGIKSMLELSWALRLRSRLGSRLGEIYNNNQSIFKYSSLVSQSHRVKVIQNKYVTLFKNI